MAGWRGNKERYGTRFYDMLKAGQPIGKVKRAMYDDHDEHRRLHLSEVTLDQIWEALMDGTFKPNRARSNCKKGKNIVRLHPESGKVVEEYESKNEAARKLGCSESMIYALIAGQAKKDYLKLKYKEETK